MDCLKQKNNTSLKEKKNDNEENVGIRDQKERHILFQILLYWLFFVWHPSVVYKQNDRKSFIIVF